MIDVGNDRHVTDILLLVHHGANFVDGKVDLENLNKKKLIHIIKNKKKFLEQIRTTHFANACDKYEKVIFLSFFFSLHHTLHVKIIRLFFVIILHTFKYRKKSHFLMMAKLKN